jgi:predicted DCC family thiol-disulfide oxidoreductase YuxK
MPSDRIIYYDGYCNLCSRTVQWIVKNDSKKRFALRPFEQTGEGQRADPESVVLEENGSRYTKTAAAIRIAMGLRFPWPVLGILLIIPRFMRDPVYDLIARNRKRWFGRRSDCFIPDG